MQTKLNLIPHEVEGKVIHQRAADGYVNATAMCKAVNKQFNDYARLKNTADFLEVLESETGIPVSELIQTLKGGDPQNQGTWVHPDVAIHLAQWLSPKFAVQVSKWVREWMSGGFVPKQTPHHLQRYMMNRAKIPHTHFSVLSEMILGLVAPLEDAGYTLPDKLVPDISEGKVFSQWLRDNRNVEPKSFPEYRHEYPDGRMFNARLYPIMYLPDFRYHFNEIWLPNYAPRYFSERDKLALSHVSKILLPSISA